METSNKYKILIVDNNPTYLKVLEFQLREIIGVCIDRLDEAYNGLHAIEMIREQPYDIAFMDIDMPVLDGIDTARFFKLNHPQTRVVGLSLYTNSEYMNEMLEAGAKDFIVKDTLDELTLTKIFTALDEDMEGIKNMNLL